MQDKDKATTMAVQRVQNAAGAERGTLPVELRAVAEIVAKGKGFWTPCSGCYDTEDGRPTRKYAHSDVFGCALGDGCGECGGLGAVWDDTDYAEMAEFMAGQPAWSGASTCGPEESAEPLFEALAASEWQTPRTAVSEHCRDLMVEILSRLERFAECAQDDEDCDIGRDWFHALATLGLLERVRRSPARWQMTDAGVALLAAPVESTSVCKACGGNDADTPCAYPGVHERQPHCLRNRRLESPNTQAPLRAAFESVAVKHGINIESSSEKGRQVMGAECPPYKYQHANDMFALCSDIWSAALLASSTQAGR